MIDPSGGEGNDRSARLLEANVGGQNPQIGIADPRKLLLDRLEEGSGDVEAGIFGIGGLIRVKAHPGAVGTAGTARRVVGSTAVPGQSDQDGCQTAVIPRRIVHEQLEFFTNRGQRCCVNTTFSSRLSSVASRCRNSRSCNRSRMRTSGRIQGIQIRAAQLGRKSPCASRSLQLRLKGLAAKSRKKEEGGSSFRHGCLMDFW
mmetsp:Transcript_12129/g.16942  ORF Transcript_12129/g.16942 Transcript_12129/m.16942 type:complete len:202 (-) Transcript_12129:22-627(-)